MNHKRGKVKSSRAGCLMCRPWKHQGAKGSARPDIMGARNFRLTQDRIVDLLPEDSMSAFEREMAALYCDNEFCDCNSYSDAYEDARWETLTGETAAALAKMNVTVTWTRNHPVRCYLTIGHQ